MSNAAADDGDGRLVLVSFPYHIRRWILLLGVPVFCGGAVLLGAVALAKAIEALRAGAWTEDANRAAMLFLSAFALGGGCALFLAGSWGRRGMLELTTEGVSIPQGMAPRLLVDYDQIRGLTTERSGLHNQLRLNTDQEDITIPEWLFRVRGDFERLRDLLDEALRSVERRESAQVRAQKLRLAAGSVFDAQERGSRHALR